MSSYTFHCIDAHTCGNPVRVVREGGPVLEGANMSERRQHFLQEYDWIRTGLMFEPRGHDVMSGSILYPPIDEENDLAILFIETSGCLPMCGHGTIGTVTVALEHDLVTPKRPGILRLETPAGLVEARYEQNGDHVDTVTIKNIASFLHSTDVDVELSELGKLKVDVAYGGNFYAIVEAQENYKDLSQLTADQILRFSPELRTVVNKEREFLHPVDSTINKVSHVQWTGKPKAPEADSRNAVFYGDHAIDRSPCGTGTSARMAQLAARGELQTGDSFVHESIIGSLFTGLVEGTTKVGDYDAITPSISGWARITGLNTIFIDDRDPYRHGFQLA